MTQPEQTPHEWGPREGARFLRAHLEVVPLPLAEDESPPSRVLVAPWGQVDLRDARFREMFDEPGAFVVNEQTAQEVPANFAKADIDYHVNLHHNRWSEGAVGWITGVEVVAGEGLYMEVEWTPRGRELLESRAYRYGSGEYILDLTPWLLDESPAPVVAVTGFALTNHPAVLGMQPIAAETINAALCAPGGQEQEATAQPPRDPGEKGRRRMHADSWKGFFSRLIGKEPADEIEAAAAVVETRAQLTETAELRTRLEAAETRVTELTAQLEEATTTIAEAQTAERETAVEAAIKAGKFGTELSAEKREQIKAGALANFEAFEAFAEAIPGMPTTPPTGQVVPDGAVGATDATTPGGDRLALDTEVKAHMATHEGVSYAQAWLAVNKRRAAEGGAA